MWSGCGSEHVQEVTKKEQVQGGSTSDGDKSLKLEDVLDVIHDSELLHKTVS